VAPESFCTYPTHLPQDLFVYFIAILLKQGNRKEDADTKEGCEEMS
jgi:hypothetical protein